MVYHGPSRGCRSCKLRRKKCDEARPSCMRCLNANRTCGGYEDKDQLIFRQYGPADEPPVRRLARKCSLPRRIPIPGTNIFPKDDLPQEVPEWMVEEFALRAFFYDYPITSTNPTIYRGYLDGLESMLTELGPESDLSKACKAVAFANGGIKLHRPVLTKKAQTFYLELLGSLAKAIEDPEFVNTAEPLMIAVLLGLYEIINAGDTRPGNFHTHARGVAAILQIENSPVDLFGAVHFLRSNHSVIFKGVPNYGIFSVGPTLDQNLDHLLLLFGSIWRKANTLLEDPCPQSDELYQLKDEVMSLDRDFERWQGGGNSNFRQSTIGNINPKQIAQDIAVGYWPGSVDTYLDVNIAGIWNTSRAARLLLINLVIKLSDVLKDGQDHVSELRNALDIADDMVASIPYHLTEDLQVFLRDIGSSEEIINPGRPVGGLYLMHPVYVASTLEILPPQMREYMRKCLAWIGTYMGIGQASVLSKAGEIDTQNFADGCMIVWAGMLV